MSDTGLRRPGSNTTTGTGTGATGTSATGGTGSRP
jgi:hypothetical protein